MLNGMVWLNHSGAQWRQLPERYGPWQSVYARFAKWRDDGILENIFTELFKDADTRISVLTRLVLKSMKVLMAGKKRRIRLSDVRKAV